MKRYYLQNESEPELRWSNASGWGEGPDFTIFVESEVKRFTHIPAGSKWVEMEMPGIMPGYAAPGEN